MFVVFDLDGTLANCEHRLHYIADREYGSKDWRAFYAACDGDRPIAPIMRTMLAFIAIGEQVEIWSGRSFEVSEKTRAWLRLQGVPEIKVRMRKVGDHRPDYIVKSQWLAECSRKPDLVFEDRASVVNMWRDNGIICCQVAPGDF